MKPFILITLSLIGIGLLFMMWSDSEITFKPFSVTIKKPWLGLVSICLFASFIAFINVMRHYEYARGLREMREMIQNSEVVDKEVQRVYNEGFDDAINGVQKKLDKEFGEGKIVIKLERLEKELSEDQ